jgi:hypothetical protein
MADNVKRRDVEDFIGAYRGRHVADSAKRSKRRTERRIGPEVGLCADCGPIFGQRGAHVYLSTGTGTARARRGRELLVGLH